MILINFYKEKLLKKIFRKQLELTKLLELHKLQMVDINIMYRDNIKKLKKVHQIVYFLFLGVIS